MFGLLSLLFILVSFSLCMYPSIYLSQEQREDCIRAGEISLTKKIVVSISSTALESKATHGKKSGFFVLDTVKTAF